MEPEVVRPSRNNRRLFTYVIAGLIVVGAILYTAYTLLLWAIEEHIYATKFGIDWFNTIFYHGYAFVIPALFALVVVYPYPNRSDFFALLRAVTTTTRTRTYGEYAPSSEGVVPAEAMAFSKWLWVGWQATKYVLAYLLAYAAQGFLFFPNVTSAVMFDIYGFGSWADIPRLFALPIFPASGQELVALIPTMEAQYYILISVIGSILLVIAIRFFLNLLSDLLTSKGNKWIVDLLAVVFFIVCGVWLGAPYWAMNVMTPLIYAVVVILMVLPLFGIAYFKLSGRGLVPITARRRAIVKVVSIVIILLLVGSLGTLAYYSVNWNNNWLQYEWAPQLQKQIYVTRWAAGISDINTSSVSNVPTGNITQMLSLIRQWDSNASLIRSQAQIGVNYLAIPNAEIVYLNGQQYWIQPTTIIYPPGGTDWISEHLIYTHADRIIVLNAHTGQYVSLSQALGVSSNNQLDNPLIYFGEQGGFSNNVYVNVQNEPPQIGNVTYSGQPDYVLSGAQRSLWFFMHGLSTWGFAFSPPQDNISMLFNRNIYNRVGSALINGLVVDPHGYPVTNGNTLYYAVMVYIDYPLQTGFAASSYLRDFGVVLVNVETGAMQPYLLNNSTSFISMFYKKYYPNWNQAPPSWLIPQLRYPEQLLGSQSQPGQLDASFLYHVNSATTWKSGSDFYERPSSTPVYYMLVNHGNTVYYVGLQLAEFMLSPGHNLGGIYVAYGGSRINQISLYQVSTSSNSTDKLIGPKAALQALETNPQIKSQLTLLTNPTLGDELPYLINSQLYYFIPVYVNTGSSSAVITKLAFMVVVDAATGVSAFGNSSRQAYSSLLASENQTIPITLVSNSTATIQSVVNAITSQGYNVSTPNFVNVNVGYQVGSIYLPNATSASVNATISSFLQKYAAPNNVHTIYEWSSEANATNFGTISNVNGILEADYIAVTQ
ncbi:MAG: hypothetical protein JRN15_01010 [Nitrososphaerota archaeon]|nr:hypothetical protein [Nitrososphaerota archaeon]